MVYILIDIINWVYGKHELIISKNKAVTSNLIIFMGILLFDKPKNPFPIYCFGAVSSIISALIMFNYVIARIIPLDYILRFSFRRDYNIFAIGIYFGLVFFIFDRLKKLSVKSLIEISIVSLIILPVLILSGSRRIIVMLILTGVLWIFLLIVKQIKMKNIKDLFISTGIIALTIICVIGLTSIFSSYMNYIYYLPNSPYMPKHTNFAETSAVDRIKTINIGAFEKRKIIWKIALIEYKNYNFKEKFFGKGNGYDIFLYDNTNDEKLINAYGGKENIIGKMSAHNFILADLLNGGIIKASFSFLLCGIIFIITMKYFLINPYNFAPYLLIFILTIGGNLISNKYGLIYDKILIITLAIFINEVKKYQYIR